MRNEILVEAALMQRECGMLGKTSCLFRGGALALCTISGLLFGREARPPGSAGVDLPLPDLALQPPYLLESPWMEHYSAPERQGVSALEKTNGGRLWASWVKNSDRRHSYVVVATSGDDGRTWTRNTLVIQPRRFVRTRTPCLWKDPQGRLWLFWGQNAGQNDGRGGVWAIVTDNPEVENPAWSEPRRIANGLPLNKPLVLPNGDWLLPFWVSPSRGVDGINLGDQNLSPYTEEMLLHDPGEERGLNVHISRDKGRTFELHGQARVGPNGNEHMMVQLGDGRLWMLVRTVYGIGQSFSPDQGRTWSPGTPYMEAENIADRRFFLRRLHSGALLMVRNNGPTKARSHVTAFVSDDEGRTWKGGLLLDGRGSTYPDGLQDPDGTIYVIYDHNRSAPDGHILMATFREEDVRAGRPVTNKVRMAVEIDRIQ